MHPSTDSSLSRADHTVVGGQADPQQRGPCTHRGPGRLLRRQLEALLTALEGPLGEVEFRVIPLMVETPAALGGPFAILQFTDEADQDVVFLEGRDGGTYLESNENVRRYEEKFRSLQEHSLSRAESLDRLAERIKQLG
jgi:hypothetical protein